MTQATPYTRSTGFADDERNNAGGRSTVRTAQVDAELDAISTPLNLTIANLALLQRDDGVLRDGIVPTSALAADTLKLMSGTGTVRGAWVTATAYLVKDLVTQSGNTYICAIAHTSGVFATDLAAVKWLLFQIGANPSAAAIPFSPTVNVTSSTVQAAIAEVDTNSRTRDTANTAAAAATATALASPANGSGADLIGGVGRVVNTVAAVRSLVKTGAGRAFALGYYAAGDGGGGQYYYDSADTASADNGGTILLAADGGRWKLTQGFPVSSKQFGAKGDNVTDDSVRLQAWLTYLATVGIGRLASGTYLHAQTLNLFNGTTILGDGFNVTQLNYSGTGDGLVITNPINSSTEANIHLQGFRLNAPNAGAQRGCLFDTGSSSVVCSEMFFNVGQANATGVVLNQSELWTFNDCYFAGTNGPWLVNGTDRSPGGTFTGTISGATMNITGVTSGAISLGSAITGAGVTGSTVVTGFLTGTGGTGTYTVNNSQLVASTALAAAGALTYFTNRIKFNNCQFNVTGFLVIDDGGIDHTLDTCNFNAGTTWIRVAGVNGFNVRGGEFENCSSVGITFVATRWQGAASITSAAASISGANFSQPLSTALVNVDATALRTFNATANTFNNAGVVFQGMDNCTSVHAADNFQGGAGDALSKINNFYTAQVASVVWDAAGTAITPGSSVISAVKSRAGRDEVLTVTVTLGAGWVGGTGNWRFTSDDVSAGLGGVGVALFQCAGAFYTGIVLMDSPAGKMTCFASNNTGAAVSATVPAAWAANTANILKFTVSYVATHQIS